MSRRLYSVLMLLTAGLFATACGGDGGDFDGSGSSGDRFFCDDGSSIPGSWVCDGDDDCAGGEDEAACGGDGGDDAGTDVASDVVDDATDAGEDAQSDAEVDAPTDAQADVPVGDGGTVASTVGPSGGTVAVGENGSLEIPPGALSEEVEITVTATPDEAPRQYVQFSPVYRFGPAGLSFDQPVTVRIPVAAPPFGAAVLWSRAAEPGFERLATTFEDGFAVAQVQHFSDGFVGDDAELPIEELPVDCLTLDVQGVSTYAPAAVRASFVVRHCGGVPMVQRLSASNITIVNDETGAPFSASLEGGGASAPARLSDILTGEATPGAPTVGLFAILSLDLSNSIVDAGSTDDVINAAQGFVDALVRDAPSSYRYQVAIQVFGRTDATRIVEAFTSDYTRLTNTLDALRESDGLGTTNLYGAYQAALEELEARAVTADIVDQTLLILTDGRHEAGDFDNQRMAALAARDAAAASGVDVYSVAVNAPPADLPFLEELATDPSFFDVVAAAAEIQAAFERTAENLRRLPEATYVVGICTPVELGTAGFSVQVSFEGVSATGSATYDAARLTGDVSACEPERVADPCGSATCGPGYLDGFSCGSCENGTCDAGACVCPAGLDFCAATRCVDLERSNSDCGACGNGCAVLQVCRDSRCAVPFVTIRAGTYTMGSPSGELGASEEEIQHEVTLTRDFWMQTTEVTQGAYHALMGTNPSCFQSTVGDLSDPGCTTGNANPSGPVETVSWFDAVSFANAWSRAEGLPECYDASGTVIGGATVYDCEGYRLPTEAEWEYAARAGTTTATYRGNLSGDPLSCDSQPNLDPIAWFCGNSDNRTRAVGTRAANAWGLYDMLGNVSEWTSDWYGTYPGAVTDPLGPSSGSARVIRGGSWYSYARSARAGHRDGSRGPGSRSFYLGFRLARTAP